MHRQRWIIVVAILVFGPLMALDAGMANAPAKIIALVALAVAIPAVIAYNHYAAKLGLFTSELEGFASEFVGTLAREGRL